jgi:two-component system response regulator AgrA
MLPQNDTFLEGLNSGDLIMLNIYICEDQISQLEFVSSFVSDYCIFRNLDAQLALAASDPFELLADYENCHNPALFFLDIDLGADINGIELASRIRALGKNASIVFITTHSELALLTLQYKVEALDFILKDSQNNIKKKIADCINTVYARQASNGKTKVIRITVEDKIIPLDMDEILFVETTGIRHKLRLHTKSRVLEFNGELKGIEEQLDTRFIRCHKSYVINKDKITEINRRASTVTLDGGSVCPVSRSGKQLL